MEERAQQHAGSVVGDLIQYGAASAISLHKRLQRDAGAVKRSGAGGKKAIVEGYIVSTVVSGSGSITKVVDTPAFLATGQAAQIEAAGDAHDTMAFAVGDRDLYTPQSGVTPTPKTLSAAEAHEFYVTGCAYVGEVAAYPALEAAKRNLLGNAWVDGEYVYSSRVAVFDDLDLFREVGHIVLHGVGWATKAYKLVDGPALIDPSRWTERALVISEAAVRSAVSMPDLSIAARALISSVVIGDTVYTATAAIEAQYRGRVIFVLLKTTLPAFSPTTRNQPVLFDYATARIEPPPLTVGSTPLSCGAHINGLVGTGGVSFSWQNDIVSEPVSGVRVVLYQFDAVSGSITASAIIADTERPNPKTYVWFTNAVECGLLFVRYTVNDAWDIYDHELCMAVGVTVVVSGLAGAGWVAWYKALPTTQAHPAWIDTAQPTKMACDIGGGRIVVIACADSQRVENEIIQWHLIELNAVTMAFVADRGPIGAMVYAPRAANQRVSVTCITPQVVVDGVVTRPAVLLATLVARTTTSSRITRLSTDGGATWKHVVSGVGGDLFYIGNKLHPVKIGTAL